MKLPCPACGFLTIESEYYGSYQLCPVCDWEDDGLQQANPTRAGGANSMSLVQAQKHALATHPLEQTALGSVVRAPRWRPLGVAADLSPEGHALPWRHPPIERLAEAYWRNPSRVYIIDGATFDTLETFYETIGRVLIPDASRCQNLDAFNDILRGGFGTPDEGFILRWRRSARSRERLGYAETLRQLQLRLSRCHPSGRARLLEAIAMAAAESGPTVFDWIVEIIQKHTASGVELVLD